MRAVNLLPKDDAQRGRRQQNLPALISTGLVVLVTGLVGVLYFSAKSASTAKDLELQDAKAELALLPTPSELASETAGQRKLASERQARITALSAALSHRVAWDRVLREISLVLPDDVWLTQLAAFSPKPPTGTTPSTTAPGAVPQGFTMAGYTYSHDAVARLITRLSVVPGLQNVWLERSLRTKLVGRYVITFTIRADVRAPGATS
jgi:Tfp pilus assembly protein PilN